MQYKRLYLQLIAKLSSLSGAIAMLTRVNSDCLGLGLCKRESIAGSRELDVSQKFLDRVNRQTLRLMGSKTLLDTFVHVDGGYGESSRFYAVIGLRIPIISPRLWFPISDVRCRDNNPLALLYCPSTVLKPSEDNLQFPNISFSCRSR